MKVPFDIPGYTEGETVNTTEFISACGFYIRQLEDLIDDLRDDVKYWKEQYQQSEFEKDNFFKPRNAYECAGVSYRDFM